MPDLLLEIGTEEIPAGYIQSGLKQMREAMQSLLQGERIGFKGINTYGSPRRLSILVTGMATSQMDADVEVLGPPKAAAYDKQGNPTKAAEGFAKSQGAVVENLKIKTTPKGEYLCVEKHIKGKAAIEVLRKNLPGLITNIYFPKSMRWGTKEIRFARPIRWILALFDSEVIPFEIDGISSDRITYGHRFLAPSPITISHPKEYVSAMEKAFVIVDIDKRKEIIAAGIAEEAQKQRGMEEGFSYDINADLLDEVACLVEYPVVLRGGFDEKYLSLPQDVVITSMCEHQRYFPVINNDTLLPYFLVVANTSQSPDIVREGNERVLRARLSDAAFFWDSDRKVSLDERVEQQKKVVWQEKVGTLYEKTQRIVEVAERIAEELNRIGKTAPLDIKGVQRAAWLCKADLLTEMVYEFPTLQGIMGYHYASSAGETENVAMAVKEHYLPKSFDGDVPETLMGAIISIADKIDSIVACFHVGLIPTGSEDPYALRRQAQGIINIILKQDLPLNLLWLIASSEQSNQILGFMKQRLEYALINRGFMADTVNAVLEADFSFPTDALLRATALEEIRKMPDIEPLSISFKRVMNILKSAPLVKAEEVNESTLKEESEHKLYRSICEIRGTVEALVAKADYLEALSILAGLRGDIDSFFDKVMVMVEDPELRRNRLSLLNEIATLFLKVADLSMLRQADMSASLKF
ncbi:MAG: glycine--tRNA ligase subunit beta [bacterium]|nr:glycine--tRNA ligase subunit beta [bacterium]